MTNDADRSRLDDLLRRAENARQSAGVASGKGSPVVANDAGPAKPTEVEKGEAEPTVTENIAAIADGVRKTGKKLKDIKEAAGGFWDKAGPVVNVIATPFKWVAGAWGWMWNKFAYNNDKETGEKHLSRSRAGAILSATFLAAVALTPTDLGEGVRHFTVDPIADAIIMPITYGNDTVFNVKAQEIDPANNIHRLTGCFTQVCTPSNTVTFNVEGRFSHGVWQTFAKGNPFFIPDRVAGAVPNGPNKCEITSYSARFRGAKYLQMFPQVLDISCVSTAGGPLAGTDAPQGNWELTPPPAPVAAPIVP